MWYWHVSFTAKFFNKLMTILTRVKWIALSELYVRFAHLLATQVCTANKWADLTSNCN